MQCRLGDHCATVNINEALSQLEMKQLTVKNLRIRYIFLVAYSGKVARLGQGTW